MRFKKRHLILHIGHAKTGTTTLQSAFSASRKSLLSAGILYPKTTNIPYHRGIIPHFMGTQAMFPAIDRKLAKDPADYLKNSAREWELMVSDINAHQPNTIIISAEQLFDTAQFNGHDTLLDAVEDLADDITVVAYIRNPAGYYLSLKQEILKQYDSRPPAVNTKIRDSLTPFLQRPTFTVKLRAFDRNKMVNGDIVADFFTHFLPDFPRQRLRRPHKAVNSSVSAEAMSILEDLHRKRISDAYPLLQKVQDKHFGRVKKVDNAIPGKTPPQYKPGVAAFVYDLAKDMQWLKDNFSIEMHPPDHLSDARPIELQELNDVADICLVDADRKEKMLDVLEIMVRRENSLLGVWDKYSQRAVRNYARLFHSLVSR